MSLQYQTALFLFSLKNIKTFVLVSWRHISLSLFHLILNRWMQENVNVIIILRSVSRFCNLESQNEITFYSNVKICQNFFPPLKTDLIISSMWLTKELPKFCNNSICLKNENIRFILPVCLPLVQTLWFYLFMFFPQGK